MSFCWPKANENVSKLFGFWGLLYLCIFHLHMPGNKILFLWTKKSFLGWFQNRKKVFRTIQRLHAFINIPKKMLIIKLMAHQKIFSIIMCGRKQRTCHRKKNSVFTHTISNWSKTMSYFDSMRCDWEREKDLINNR